MSDDAYYPHLLSALVMDYSQFESHYHQYKQKIFSYLYYRSGRNREVAEDLAAEVFMKALEKIESYKVDQSFQAWIYRIAHNHMIDHFRKTKPIVALDDLENILESDTVETNAEHRINARLAAEQVAELLPHLSESERDIVLMRYHQNLSNKEIADITDESEGNVRVILHRALSKLSKQAAILFPCLLVLFLLFQ